MCLYPRLIKNKKYTPNKKNGGNVPEIKDRRALVVPVKCNRCIECRKQKTNEWRIRLTEDIKTHTNGKFVTLTFNESSLTELKSKFPQLKGYALENAAAVLGVRRFLERWRKKYKKSVRHWLVTELGQTSTERIHIHGIIWTDKIEDISIKWKYGHINIGKQRWNLGKLIQDGEHYINRRSINYMVKYLSKADPIHKEYIPKMMNSAGIGKNYTSTKRAKQNHYKKNNTRTYYKTPEGLKLSLPIYYRNKIYNDEQREQLWMELLDKQERWVNGIKVDISNGNEDYFKILKYQQTVNKRLGFGDDKKNWERLAYEEQRRDALLDRVRNGTIKKAVDTAGHNAIDKKQDKELVSYIKSLSLEKLKNIF